MWSPGLSDTRKMFEAPLYVCQWLSWLDQQKKHHSMDQLCIKFLTPKSPKQKTNKSNRIEWLERIEYRLFSTNLLNYLARDFPKHDSYATANSKVAAIDSDTCTARFWAKIWEHTCCKWSYKAIQCFWFGMTTSSLADQNFDWKWSFYTRFHNTCKPRNGDKQSLETKYSSDTVPIQ